MKRVSSSSDSLGSCCFQDVFFLVPSGSDFIAFKLSNASVTLKCSGEFFFELRVLPARGRDVSVL